LKIVASTFKLALVLHACAYPDRQGVTI